MLFKYGSKIPKKINTTALGKENIMHIITLSMQLQAYLTCKTRKDGLR